MGGEGGSSALLSALARKRVGYPLLGSLTNISLFSMTKMAIGLPRKKSMTSKGAPSASTDDETDDGLPAPQPTGLGTHPAGIFF